MGAHHIYYKKTSAAEWASPEESEILVQDDPTWAHEYRYFKDLCTTSETADLSTDRWLNRSLATLGEEALGVLSKS